MQGALKLLQPIERPSVADRVFEELHRQILTLVLPPGTRLSEAEVAAARGVSRQPVRDAFHRPSTLGFLTMRPQRVTLVSLISPGAVLQACFLRTLIELEVIRAACSELPPTTSVRLRRFSRHSPPRSRRRTPRSFTGSTTSSTARSANGQGRATPVRSSAKASRRWIACAA